MTELLIQNRAKAVAACLEETSAKVAPAGSRCWTCVNKEHLRVKVSLVDDWLVVEGPPPYTTSDILNQNLALPAFRKFVCRGDRLRAEVPVSSERWRGRLAALVSDWHAGPVSASGDRATIDALKHLCESAGWEYAERKDAVAIELECATGHFAVLNNAAQVRLELLVEEKLAPDSKSAIRTVLVRANDRLRFIRGWMYEQQTTCRAGFEVLFPDLPDESELKCALGSLSIACQCCAEEVAALSDETTAAWFNTAQGQQRNEKKGDPRETTR